MTKTYAGSCHCGAVRFEIDANIDHVRVCDCSICSKRGALIHRVPADAFRLLTPLDALSVYRWGSLTAADYFCPVCGILPFRKPSYPTIEERAVGLAPVGVDHRPLLGLGDRGLELVDVVGVVDIDLNHIGLTVEVEKALRLGDRHEAAVDIGGAGGPDCSGGGHGVGSFPSDRAMETRMDAFAKG